MKSYQNLTEEVKYAIVHDNTNIIVSSKLEIGNQISTGQPELNIYDTEPEFIFAHSLYTNGQEKLDEYNNQDKDISEEF